ncbi:neurogenic differentiation factor 1 [Anastrepha obliqua]|uniref:neurogenic differentiation factor 1 n=1 Tax=Anastrepha obliqua TaxID=95512 RepID=UPI0024095AC7|nr:neurogenic differentiation factor 1 [Anastrepha obliqua]
MPRRKRASSPFDPFDDDFDEDASSQSSKNGNPPVQRNAANARERARMRVLSSAFGRLKTKLPNIPPDTKLSKLDTLRLATMYIKQLKVLVEGGTTSSDNMEAMQESSGIFNMQGVPQSMTWPFGFHHMQSNSNNSSSRLQTLQYPPSEWNHTRNTYSKYGRMSNSNAGSHNSNYQQDSNILHSHHWYTTEEPMTEDISINNNNCAFFESQSEHHFKQNHDIPQAHHQLFHTNHSNMQSSIR